MMVSFGDVLLTWKLYSQLKFSCRKNNFVYDKTPEGIIQLLTPSALRFNIDLKPFSMYREPRFNDKTVLNGNSYIGKHVDI